MDALPPFEIDPEAESIIQEIHDAFKKVKRGPLSLHQAMIYEYENKDPDNEGRKDADTSWDQIPDNYIEAGGDALYNADPLSWQYFIPAFMIWALRFFRVKDSFVSDQTIYAFDLSDDQVVRREQVHRFSYLSKQQNKAISRFLCYMSRDCVYADSDVAKHALDAYWNQFCDHEGDSSNLLL